MPFPVSEDEREVSQYIRRRDRATVIQSFLSHLVKPGTEGHNKKSWNGKGGKNTETEKGPHVTEESYGGRHR